MKETKSTPIIEGLDKTGFNQCDKARNGNRNNLDINRRKLAALELKTASNP